MPTPTANERGKAVRLRAKVKVGAEMRPEDVEWLHEYEKRQDATREARGGSRTHEVSYTEKSAEAAGTGSAAEVAAAAVFAREEGRQYDKMLDRVILATEKTCALHERMAEALLNRAIEDGKVIRETLVAWRAAFIEKTELEAENIKASAEDSDGLSKLAEQLLPMLMPMLAGGKPEKKSS